MQTKTTANHFDTIADVYNKMWRFSGQYQNGMLENILELLHFTTDDILVDIGGGTGLYTRLIRDAAGISEAYCIEPSRNMYLEARKISAIRSICADAKGFMELNLTFSKVLLKEVVHHIKERAALWTYLRGALPESGKVLIVTRPQDIALPLFEKARDAFRHNQPHHETLLSELYSCGFDTAIRVHPYSFPLDKAVWFDMIRKRFMSDLAKFTDEEIEAGIREIDERYPEQQRLEILDNILYITGSIANRNS